jgi:ABC-type antimicrobial peptide transport system permease subunit
MLVTVTQRTREIGVRKAIGAARREILYQFLLEAVILSGSGALVGILIGTSIPFIIRPLIPGGLSIRISRISIVTAFVVSCMTGVIFGYLPARRAAKLQPTEALQHE